MSISSVGINTYQNSNATTSSVPSAAAATSDAASATTYEAQSSSAGSVSNSSNLSAAISNALAQMNGGGNLSSLLTPASQQSASDFMNSLLAFMPSSPASSTSQMSSLPGALGYSSNGSPAPVTLDQSSPTIKLQTTIQNLITQLGENSTTSDLLGGSESDSSSGLMNLQQSFNNLVTASGGNPSQASMQTFLKTIATNIENSMSIGNLLDASA